MTSILHCELAKCYKELKKYKLMEEHLLLAFEEGNIDAMIELGYYYQGEKNYEKMLKYLLIASEKGNAEAMNNLGIYYKTIGNDKKNMLKYYLMAIEKGNYYAMYNLGLYYEKEKNYEQMCKYYVMAIELGHKNSRVNLNDYITSQGNMNYFIQYKKYLSKENLQFYNKQLVNYLEGKDVFNNLNFVKIECEICKNTNYMIDLYCNHIVCNKCYIKLDKCPFCRDPF